VQDEGVKIKGELRVRFQVSGIMDVTMALFSVHEKGSGGILQGPSRFQAGWGSREAPAIPTTILGAAEIPLTGACGTVSAWV